MNDVSWDEIIVPQSLNLIIGRKRGGKSCLGYHILEHLNEKSEMDCGVFGLPEEKSHLLPDFIKPIHGLDLPENTAILFDEAYISFHARSSLSAVNKTMDTLSGLVGQKDIIALFITQQTRKLDIGVVSAADALIFKMPSMLQARFERPEIRKLSKEVYESFKENISREENKQYAYVITDDFEEFVKNPVPSFWTEELSKAFAGVDVGGGGGKPDTKKHKRKRESRQISKDEIPLDAKLVNEIEFGSNRFKIYKKENGEEICEKISK